MAALAARGRDAPAVSLIARRWASPAAGPDAPTWIRCDPFYVGSLWRDASFARGVQAIVARERFDLVQSHERIPGLPIYRAGDGVHASWLERRARHGSVATRIGIASNPHHRWLVATERAMFEHPALRAVICNSTLVRDEIASRFAIDPAKLVLVRNGVDVERFHPRARDAHRAAVRRALAIDDATPTFVAVGSGFERKGVAPALAALVDVPGACLVVVGADKHASRYAALADRLGVATRTRFVGAVDDPLPYLAMADAFVLPTLYDPFPNAALEAFASGLPVITSDGCGAAELIDDGVDGWRIGDVDPARLTAAMRAAAARDATTVASMSAAARTKAEPWTLERVATSLVALYRRLLDDAVA